MVGDDGNRLVVVYTYFVPSLIIFFFNLCTILLPLPVTDQLLTFLVLMNPNSKVAQSRGAPIVPFCEHYDRSDIFPDSVRSITPLRCLHLLQLPVPKPALPHAQAEPSLPFRTARFLIFRPSTPTLETGTRFRLARAKSRRLTRNPRPLLQPHPGLCELAPTATRPTPGRCPLHLPSPRLLLLLQDRLTWKSRLAHAAPTRT